MNSKKQKEQRIVGMWLLRPDSQRGQNDAEPFTIEVWDAGLRLDHNDNTHYQLVMNLIRRSIKDSE